MENNEKEELIRENVKTLRSLKYWIAHYVLGFGRYSIKNNHIVKKSLNSIIYGACVLVIANITLIHLIYETAILVHYLMFTELVILLQLSVIINLFSINITFSKTSGLASLINYCMDIDLLLGRAETKFMRMIADKAYVVMGIPIVIVQITIVTFMYFTFEVSMTVHVTGSAFFIWMLSIFYDINYLLTHSAFLSLRTRYLNVALMKFLNIKLEYAPDLFLFTGLFWKAKYNDLVTFHKKADTAQFIEGYVMILNGMKMFQECYKFAILVGIMCVTVGSLLTVQTVIIYGRTGMDMLRQSIMVSWLLITWMFVFSMCLQIDIFSRQIDQTKLICTFAQLKSITDERVYRFTKAILRSMEIREGRMSIYGIFYFDPAMMLRLAASIFVYLTAQLQLTLPAMEETNIYTNITTVTDDD